MKLIASSFVLSVLNLTYLFFEFSVLGGKFVDLLLHFVKFLLLLKATLQSTLSVLKQAPLPLRQVSLLDFLLNKKELVVG